jgi:hypothetical protein
MISDQKNIEVAMPNQSILGGSGGRTGALYKVLKINRITALEMNITNNESRDLLKYFLNSSHAMISHIPRRATTVTASTIPARITA